MRFYKNIFSYWATTLIVAATTCLSAQTLSSSSSGGGLVGDWPVVGQDLGNHNTAPSSINSSNVSTLLNNQAWFFSTLADTGGGFGSFVAGQPSVANGVAYFGDQGGFVYAVNTSNGAQIWKTNVGNPVLTTPAITSQNIYVTGSNLFGTLNNPVIYIFCISRADGHIVWKQPLGPLTGVYPFVQDNTGLVSVVGNLVIFGVANSENVFSSPPFKSRGIIEAFNASNGSLVWRFYTTSDQLSTKPLYGAGVGSFSSPGIDVGRQTVYIGTGQNFSFPTSPYQDSLMAINYTNGNLLWFSEMSVNDSWGTAIYSSGPDSDVNTHPNLFSVNKVDYVGVADKAGRYYIIKRDAYLQQNQDYNSQGGSNINMKHFPPIVATLQLDQASQPGTIQATPTIDEVNDILYVVSDAIPNANDPTVRITMNAAYLTCPSDPVGELFCSQSLVVPKIEAYDLVKLVQGVPQASALIWSSVNLPADPNNRGETFGDLTMTNDVLFTTNGYGSIRALNKANGALLAEVQPGASNPMPNLGIPPQNIPIFGGVTIVGKQIFVPTAGGIVSYKLP